MKILLTGVSGYLGGVLAARLAELPEVERITGTDIAPPAAGLPGKVDFIRLDARSPEMAACVAGCEIVIHTAFIVLWKASLPAAAREEINIEGTLNVARAAMRNETTRFFHTSSIAAYAPARARDGQQIREDDPLDAGDSFFYYRNDKARVEKALAALFAASPERLLVFRPSYVVGPSNRETVPAYRKTLVKIPGRDPRPQYVHEDDVASAMIHGLRQRICGAYNLAPDDSLSLAKVGNMIGMPRVPTLPIWLARWVTALRWRYAQATVHPAWVDESYPRLNYAFSNAKMKATGWLPRYSSEAAFRSMLIAQPHAVISGRISV